MAAAHVKISHSSPRTAQLKAALAVGCHSNGLCQSKSGGNDSGLGEGVPQNFRPTLDETETARRHPKERHRLAAAALEISLSLFLSLGMLFSLPHREPRVMGVVAPSLLQSFVEGVHHLLASHGRHLVEYDTIRRGHGVCWQHVAKEMDESEEQGCQHEDRAVAGERRTESSQSLAVDPELRQPQQQRYGLDFFPQIFAPLPSWSRHYLRKSRGGPRCARWTRRRGWLCGAAVPRVPEV